MAADERAALQALLDGFEQHEVSGDVGFAVFQAIERAIDERREPAGGRVRSTPIWFESLPPGAGAVRTFRWH